MNRRMAQLIRWAKGESVLLVALVCALASMALVPPSRSYWEYIDLRVLCLLFCLMAVVAGFQRCGVFQALAQRLLSGEMNMRRLTLMLVLMPFFCSMLITNDVALIAFVPFTLMVLDMVDHREHTIYIVVLQTIAANLGSMATPVGNPQNLYLYARFLVPTGAFFATMLPLTVISLIGLCAAVLPIKGQAIRVQFKKNSVVRDRRMLTMLCVLFVLCLISVFRLLNYAVLALIVVAWMLVFARDLFRRVDYGLLFTFVCFFVFAGNMGETPAVRQAISGFLNRGAVLSSALTSQLISNVPAAVLLSGFTDDWRGLLAGTNIGGLGTLIASLASLISFKYYVKASGARPAAYMGAFTLINGIGLIALLGAAWALGLM